MHILITGSAGFIGYFLTRELLKDRLRIYGTDSVNDHNEARLNDCGSYGHEVHSRFFPGYRSRKPDLCAPEARNRLFHEILAEAILKEKPVQMFNNRHPERNFTHVTDITGSISRIITHDAIL